MYVELDRYIGSTHNRDRSEQSAIDDNRWPVHADVSGWG